MINIIMKSASEFLKETITRNNLICFIEINICVFVINLMKEFFF